jgi:hypothetical protein
LPRLFSISVIRYDSQRLIEGANRPVRDGLQFLKGLGVGTTAFKADSHASERCAQIVRYLIADPCHLGDEDLDFVQHAVCDCGKFVERMIEPRDRNTLAQVARHDAPNESIQVCDASVHWCIGCRDRSGAAARQVSVQILSRTNVRTEVASKTVFNGRTEAAFPCSLCTI